MKTHQDQKHSMMPLAQITVDADIVVDHNYPCSICGKNHAVYKMPEGIFSPCWECQGKNWYTLKINSWLLRKILRIKN